MVAKTTPLPNIRKLFIPDVGMVIADFDLEQADARVVAWEANDEELKAIFRDPKADLHDENAKTIFGKLTEENRQLAKGGVHATNYGCSAPTLARSLGVTVKQAEAFQRTWFQAHPGIHEWHRRVERELQTTRMVRNKFGNCRYYFDRIERLLPEALAWLPQSTVALVIERGMVNIDNNLPDVELLMQVHDSLVMQYPTTVHPQRLPDIKREMEIIVPYDDPLIIPVSPSVSMKSWGDVVDVDWEGNPTD